MRSLLITGGTGTFGKEFVKHCLSYDLYEKIIIFSRDEYKQYIFMKQLKNIMGEKEYEEKVRFFLGDIRDIDRLKTAMRNVTHVVHSAALKHVPFCEYNPGEAIKTNVDGTRNVCNAAIECRVKNLVVLSTDKAVEPINFYGASKMLSERYAVHSNNLSIQATDKKKSTRISCVRYGNVLGSRGSIIESFKNMKSEDKFKITHPEMTRFWMDIQDSVKMVAWSLDNCLGGEIVIPKLKSSKVIDLAKAVDNQKEIEIIGIRPGEKIHEQLFSRREYTRAYDVDEYYVILPEDISWSSDIKPHYEKNYKMSDRKSYYSNDSDLLMSKNEIDSLVEL